MKRPSDEKGVSIDFTLFDLPESVNEADNRVVYLQAEIEHIGIQLDDGNRRPGMNTEKYLAWRKSAAEARRLKKAEQGWLRNWLKNSSVKLKPEDMQAGGLLLASLPMLNNAAEKGLIDDGGFVILEAVRGYVRNRFPSVGGLITGTTNLEETNAA